MKRLPTLTKSQRRALLMLEWGVLIGLVVYSVWQRPSPDPSLVGRGEKTNGKTIITSPNKGKAGRGSLPQETPFETFPFDPNTADSTTLLRLGLSPWQVRSIYRYRAKHGRYHKPEDFMRVPNLTNEQWERLKPYIRIAKKYQYVAPLQTSPRGGRLPSQSIHEVLIDADTIKKSPSSSGEGLGRGLKLRVGEAIDINTADTTLLKMIPGIASKRAARIVAYRNKLGGFVAVEQAMEATEMPDSVLQYMTVSALPVTKINVNKLSIQQMMKHPYLNFYQAKAIFEHRRNKGELHSVEELSRLDGFRPTDIDRLQAYVEF